MRTLTQRENFSSDTSPSLLRRRSICSIYLGNRLRAVSSSLPKPCRNFRTLFRTNSFPRQLRNSVTCAYDVSRSFTRLGVRREIHRDENEKALAKRKPRTRFEGDESPGNEALTSLRISRSNTNVYRDTTATSAQIISVINGTGCYAIAPTKTACPDRFPSLVIASSRLI